MFSIEELQVLSEADITQVDKYALADIMQIHIDPEMPVQQRIEKYFTEVKNPYCFRYGETTIKINFSPDGKPLQDVLQNYLKNKWLFHPNMLYYIRNMEEWR